MSKPANPIDLGRNLLIWYDRHHRTLPWRLSPQAITRGERPDPYYIWLSEIMLQQTTVTAVKPYFDAFTNRWPTVADLAAADIEDVMKGWAGLGYYSRARNLKKCADTIIAQHQGKFPDDIKALLALPGIGPYTSAAIASIAFNKPHAVVDGNVERVITRLFTIDTPLPAAKTAIYAKVNSMLPQDRPGDFAQATMDLGATICTPRNPICSLCPFVQDCLARLAGTQTLYPIKSPKPEKPVRRGAAFVAERNDGAILLRKRPEKGLLGGMTEVPTTDWTANKDGSTGAHSAPFLADWTKAGQIKHVFTHFELHLDVYHAQINFTGLNDHWWSEPDTLFDEALPTVMKKVIKAAQKQHGHRNK